MDAMDVITYLCYLSMLVKGPPCYVLWSPVNFSPLFDVLGRFYLLELQKTTKSSDWYASPKPDKSHHWFWGLFISCLGPGSGKLDEYIIQIF